MNFAKMLLPVSLLFSSVLASGQGGGVTAADLQKPLKDSWLTYNGDYTGKRYSALTQVNRSTVKDLTLAWMSQVTAGPGTPAAGGAGRRNDREALPVNVGGEGPGNISVEGGSIKCSVLEVDGTLYLTMPDNAWALDARDGHELWHYFWKTKGGTHIGNHVLVGVGNDIDSPGFLQSYDPETGELQWKHYTVPMQKGDPGLDTWASLDAARHGGAQPWIAGAYDPDTNLYIFGTGNPTPAFTTGGRGDKDNLFTCSLIAVNVDTGKMAWYYQTSPHDMHDYDSAQTPVLVDGEFNGKQRKMVMTAARNGYFFVLDRVTGEHLLTSKYGRDTNWAGGLTPAGGPKRDPSKDATVAGSLVSPNSDGTVNWEPPAYSPQTGLLYVAEDNSFAIFYLTDVDPRGSMGLGGREEAQVGSAGSYLTAINYKTGKAAWRHRYFNSGGGGGGVLATAGGLVFAGDGAESLIAHDAATGDILWNTRVGRVSNAPQTYMLDGHQYVICATGNMLWSFMLY